MIKNELEKLITDKAAVIGVIGLGYVGLPLIVEFCLKGFKAIGFEVDEAKTGEIKAGRSYIVDVTSENLKKCIDSGKLTATTDFSKLADCDVIILESTTYPGTTDEVLQPMFEKKGFKLDEDFLLAFSPERVDPGNPQFQTHNIQKVVGGVPQ